MVKLARGPAVPTDHLFAHSPSHISTFAALQSGNNVVLRKHGLYCYIYEVRMHGLPVNLASTALDALPMAVLIVDAAGRILAQPGGRRVAAEGADA